MQGIYPELAKELGIVFRQTQSGSPDQAYSSFARRIEIPEVVAWCAMMQQSQKLGGGLAPALGDYASRIRIDRQSKAERVGNTASLKLLFPVVLCLAPPIAILLIGPAVIELRDFINREKGTTLAAFEEVEKIQP
jgi:tight adherence protein C